MVLALWSIRVLCGAWGGEAGHRHVEAFPRVVLLPPLVYRETWTIPVELTPEVVGGMLGRSGGPWLRCWAAPATGEERGERARGGGRGGSVRTEEDGGVETGVWGSPPALSLQGLCPRP